MRRVLIRLVPIGVLATLAFAGAALSPKSADSGSVAANKVYQHALDVELGRATDRPGQMPVSGGVIATLREQLRALPGPAANIDVFNTEGCQNVFTGGGQRNIRANQDCSFRRQAEEAIAINPLNAQNMIAGQNDSRLGYNHCGYDWTLDGGNHWGDQTPPFWQYALLDNHTSDACSDPTVAFDSQGNAYVAGVIFDVNSAASSIVVAKSNAGLNGSFYHSPDPTGGLQEYRDTPLGVVSADASSAASNDKEFIAADAHASSPKHDNVYMTWTLFTGGHSPIYFSQSTNGGATWSSRIAISGSSVPLCGGPCNNDQGSQATVGAGGAVFVTFGNSNTGTANGQTLFVKCGATGRLR